MGLWSSAASSVPWCRDTLRIPRGSLGAACAGALPAVTLVPAVGLRCHHGDCSSAHLLPPGAAHPGAGLALLLPCCPLRCSPGRLPSPARLASDSPARTGAVGAGHGIILVLQVTAVSLVECCSPSVLLACPSWRREEALRCTKAVNRSHEAVNINYLQARPPEDRAELQTEVGACLCKQRLASAGTAGPGRERSGNPPPAWGCVLRQPGRAGAARAARGWFG